MNCVLTILTGLSILAHSVFGCCDHTIAAKSNPRSACCCHGASPVRTSKVAEDANSKAPAKAAFSPSHSNPAKDHICKHASCHWLSGGKVDHAEVALDIAADFSVPLFAADSYPWTCQSDKCPTLPDRDAPPLRLHLLVGVLLV
jgi:hypothetical protein